ncbi:MAG: VTT domain-containing protein [Acidimicrobiales bacterium]
MHLLAILNFTGFVTSAGYGAIFLLCVLQSCCVPTSSELTMGFAGVLAAEGKLNLPEVIVIGALGEVVGAYIAWAVGRYAGRAAVDRFGRYVLLSHRDLDRAEAWYERHQRFGVFGSRLLPVIRNFVALPAGIAEVPLLRFGVLTAAGSLIWDGAWAGLGDRVGAHWHTIAKGFGDIGYVLGVLAVGVIAFGIFHRYRSYKAGTQDRDESGEPGLGDGAPGRDQHDPAAGTMRWVGGSSGTPPSLPPSTVISSRGDRWVTSSTGEPRQPRDFPNSPVAAWEAAVKRGHPDTDAPGRVPLGGAPPAGGERYVSSPPRRRGATNRAESATAPGQLPLVGRIFPAPVAAKVPEIIFLFWVVKVLSTAGGEAVSDFFKTYGNLKGGALEVGLFLIALVLQFGTRRYRAFAYWFLAFAIAIFGTGVSDFLHLDVGIPYAGTTALWAVILATIFLVWHRSERTLSIHSITTQRREAYYWATVFATFALGTALGDFTASSLHFGYLASGVLFGVLIFLPALAWWKFGLNSVAAFWMSYVLTRPLGASFADYISKPHSRSGIANGNGPTAVVFVVAVFVLVAYLAVTRSDIQGSGLSQSMVGDRRARLSKPAVDVD